MYEEEPISKRTKRGGSFMSYGGSPSPPSIKDPSLLGFCCFQISAVLGLICFAVLGTTVDTAQFATPGDTGAPVDNTVFLGEGKCEAVTTIADFSAIRFEDGFAKYPHPKSLCWILDAGPVNWVELKFLEFDLGEGVDFVNIYKLPNPSQAVGDEIASLTSGGQSVPVGPVDGYYEGEGRYMLVELEAGSANDIYSGFVAIARQVATKVPTKSPTLQPTNDPTREPSPAPSTKPTDEPSSSPSRAPTALPTTPLSNEAGSCKTYFDETAQGDSGTITPYNGGQSYPDDLDECWLIRCSDPSEIVRFTITDVGVIGQANNGDDFLNVYEKVAGAFTEIKDSNGLNDFFSPKTNPTSTVLPWTREAGQETLIRFRSDLTQENPGSAFTSSWTCQTAAPTPAPVPSPGNGGNGPGIGRRLNSPNEV